MLAHPGLPLSPPSAGPRSTTSPTRAVGASAGRVALEVTMQNTKSALASSYKENER